MFYFLFFLSVQTWAQDPLVYLYQKRDWNGIYLQLQLSQKQNQRLKFQKLEGWSAPQDISWQQSAKIFSLEKELKLLTKEDSRLRSQSLEFRCQDEIASSTSVSALVILARNSLLPLACRKKVSERILDLTYAVSTR